jgi:phage FluMu gp28-like protein
LHTVPIQKAIDQGIVERINAKTGQNETRSEFVRRLESECLDPEQWAQEYCCQPADEASAFLSFEMLLACEADCMRDRDYLADCRNPLYLGGDFARTRNFTVFDVGEQIGDVIWDRFRLELHNKTFPEQTYELNRLLSLPMLKRACLDHGGLGMQMSEEARQRFGWKVEPIDFTPSSKEEMAYRLRAAFEDKKLRIPRDMELRADLRGIRKQVTSSGNIRFDGESKGSHCDRFWAKALRQHALSSNQGGIGAMTW